jgi:hypothetical protein
MTAWQTCMLCGMQSTSRSLMCAARIALERHRRSPEFVFHLARIGAWIGRRPGLISGQQRRNFHPVAPAKSIPVRGWFLRHQARYGQYGPSRTEETRSIISPCRKGKARPADLKILAIFGVPVVIARICSS